MTKVTSKKKDAEGARALMANYDIMRRALFWIIQVCVLAFGTYLNSINSELKARMTAIENNQAVRNEQLIKLEGLASRTSSDLVEMRATLRNVETIMTEQRLLIAKAMK